ncbi:hypothetical protein [Streptomyces arenae]|uniref:phage baseplate protein n=1 Tax=Streptomyces arenae TaxID=29301 RepID=UPI002659E9C9|nr:hypothetical protein [Streptomyces arenae]MCG7208247.1 hypothetical protein [Streptomyces arenae]
MREKTEDSGASAVSRRTLLRTGTGMAAAAVSGGLSVFAAQPASADVGASQRFDLGGNGGKFFVNIPLHQPYWAMQSFAFDHVYGHIYYVQTKVGSENGDLWVTRTDMTGQILGAMAIHGFDHGSNIAIEPDTYGSPYMWVPGDWRDLHPEDPDSKPNSHTIARFKYVDGGDLSYSNSAVRKFPILLSDFHDCPRPAIDPYNNRILLRYMGTTSPWRLALFDLPGVLSKGFVDDKPPRLAARALPSNSEIGLTDKDDFQGVTAYGQYAYLLYGGHPEKTTDPAVPSYLVTLDMNDVGSSVKEVFPTHAGDTLLPGREPQGIAVYRSPTGPQLAFGFSSKYDSDLPAQFRSTIFYKTDLKT